MQPAAGSLSGGAGCCLPHFEAVQAGQGATSRRSDTGTLGLRSKPVWPTTTEENGSRLSVRSEEGRRDNHRIGPNTARSKHISGTA